MKNTGTTDLKTIVNGTEISLQSIPSERNLLEFLREDLDLTSVKKGCGIGVCGSCMVLIDEVPMQACKRTVADIIDSMVLTVEGMAHKDAPLHPLQQAFIDAGAIQCGFCTPGMVLTAHALLLRNPQPTREEIRTALKGNLCRCTGYQQIVDAVESAAAYYQQ